MGGARAAADSAGAGLQPRGYHRVKRQMAYTSFFGVGRVSADALWMGKSTCNNFLGPHRAGCGGLSGCDNSVCIRVRQASELLM